MRVRELSRCVCDGRHRRGVLLRAAPVGNGAGPGTKIQSFTTPLPRASLSQRYRRAVPRARLSPGSRPAALRPRLSYQRATVARSRFAAPLQPAGGTSSGPWGRPESF